MTDNRLSGLALITGTVGSIITMTLHPTGHVPAANVEPMIRMLIAVHALALACVPLLFLGALGLSRQLAPTGRLAVAGLTVYTFALLAVMNAAVADGLVTPNVVRQIVAPAGSPSAIEGWRMMSHYNFYVNQAYAQVFVAASAVAILLWSISVWRGKELALGLGIYGCILAPVTLLALFSGRLTLDAHGFGIVVFSQAVWFIVAGTLLLRSENPVSAAAA